MSKKVVPLDVYIRVYCDVTVSSVVALSKGVYEFIAQSGEFVSVIRPVYGAYSEALRDTKATDGVLLTALLRRCVLVDGNPLTESQVLLLNPEIYLPAARQILKWMEVEDVKWMKGL